jgi:hypothetical protein
MMSDRVKVKTLRMHFGDQGQKVEGDEYDTTKVHADQLKNLNLVTIIGEAEAKAEPAPANKAEQVPANKAAEPVVTTAPSTPKPARQRAAKAKK